MNTETTYMIEKVSELPPAQRRGRKSGVWIERLKPVFEVGFVGEWFKVAEGPYANISRKAWLLKGKNDDGTDKVAKPPGNWDFAVRSAGETDGNKLGALYATYLGDTELPDAG